MDSLNNHDNKNEEIESLEDLLKLEPSLNKIKNNIKKENISKNPLTSTIVNKKDFKSILGYEQNQKYSIFEDGYKSDDEENIKDQNEIYEIKGRKSLSESDIKQIEQLNQSVNNKKVYDMEYVIDKWNYEKILLNNNIIDYNCKQNILYFYFK